jgi:arylsulfatase A-like enzyme
VTDAALAWLAQERSAPFFLWVHYFGPHEKPDWRVAEERRERRRIGMYDPDTVAMDGAVGRLLDGLEAGGLGDDTLVVFHADHGESLGENGLIGHGQLLNEASLRIPLILRYPPAVARGVRVGQLARNVDILPTVLDVLGIESQRELSGESLLPLVGSAPARGLAAVRERFRDERVAYLETYYPAHVAFATPVTLPDGQTVKVGLIRRGLQTRDWKYVRSDPHPVMDVDPDARPAVPEELKAKLVHEELYDLSSKAGESRNVAKQHPDVLDELRALFERHLEAERGAAPPVPVDVDPEMKLRLKSLGYSG